MCVLERVKLRRCQACSEAALSAERSGRVVTTLLDPFKLLALVHSCPFNNTDEFLVPPLSIQKLAGMEGTSQSTSTEAAKVTEVEGRANKRPRGSLLPKSVRMLEIRSKMQWLMNGSSENIVQQWQK